MELGQIVIHNQNDMLKYSIIISRNNESYDILHLELSLSIYNVNIKSLFYLYERFEVENLINAKLDLKIEEIKSNIKSVKLSDYSQEIKEINKKRNMISYYLKSSYVTSRIKTLDEETLKLIENK